MAIPGFTAEKTIGRGAHYRTSLWRNAASSSVEAAYAFPFGSAGVRSRGYGIVSELCCWKCAARGEFCVITPQDPQGCICIPELPPRGGGSRSVD